jgi:hypothetical protein
MKANGKVRLDWVFLGLFQFVNCHDMTPVGWPMMESLGASVEAGSEGTGSSRAVASCLIVFRAGEQSGCCESPPQRSRRSAVKRAFVKSFGSERNVPS